MFLLGLTVDCHCNAIFWSQLSFSYIVALFRLQVSPTNAHTITAGQVDANGTRNPCREDSPALVTITPEIAVCSGDQDKVYWTTVMLQVCVCIVEPWQCSSVRGALPDIFSLAP